MKQRVLAIGAHPDDIEIGCGGTLRLLFERGAEINHVVVTSGEEGSLAIGGHALARQREAEASRSGSILGASKVSFLHAEDGLTTYAKELKIELVSMVREYRPDILFIHAAQDHFPDHRIVHQLAIAAAGAAAGPWYPSAGGTPHQIQQILGYEVWHPLSQHQLAVDISSTMHVKRSALEQHQSQIANVNYLAAIQGLAQYRGAMTLTGTLAEVFEVLRLGAVL